MTQWVIGDLLTGQVSTFVQPVSGSWSTEINGPGSISVSVTLADPDNRALTLANVATVGKSFLAVVENEVILNAGPIWSHEYDEDTDTLDLSAAGMWTYFDHRVLIPVLTAGQTPLDVTTYFGSESLSNIAKALVAQAQTATGGNVPVVLPADVTGTATREYLGVDLSLVGDALVDLTAVENGPEIDFNPRWANGRQKIEWVMRVGTPTVPQLFSPSTHVWDKTVPEPSLRSLKVKKDGSRLVGTAWASSGSSSVGLYSQYPSTVLTGQGYPLLETVDSTHATDLQSELDGYARENARVGSKPTEFWSFQARADVSPFVGEYTKGDYCIIKICNNHYLPDGNYRRRITNLSGDQDGKWVSVTTGEVYSLNG